MEFAKNLSARPVSAWMGRRPPAGAELVKQEDDEEGQAILPQSPTVMEDIPLNEKDYMPKKNWHLRTVFELSMATTMVLLLARQFSTSCSIVRSPVPEFPRKMYTFSKNPKYMSEDMFTNQHATLTRLHNWIELSSDSRGYVQVGDVSPYNLTNPYIVAISREDDGPAYMMSVFHQLHCLSYLVEHYQMDNRTQEVVHHSIHCFEYLRQALMCAADTTLEGKTDEGPAFGVTHECKDYDAVLEWANKHATNKWRGFLPDEAVL